MLTSRFPFSVLKASYGRRHLQDAISKIMGKLKQRAEPGAEGNVPEAPLSNEPEAPLPANGATGAPAQPAVAISSLSERC